jgi:flagellar protein FliS
MNLNETGLSYRRSAIEGASPIGLIIVLFDTLAGDFRRAAVALRSNDIEARCKELNHAALVLGQLENWVDPERGGEWAQTLLGFYAYLRRMMVEAAVKKSESLLDTQIEMILHVRAAWQMLDIASPSSPSLASLDRRVPTRPTSSYSDSADTETDRLRFSQSA